jgi:hypothetical protein
MALGEHRISTAHLFRYFVNRQKQVFDTAIDIAYLERVQAHVAELACNVMDTVTHMGWQFPGGAGPGKPIMERS